MSNHLCPNCGKGFNRLYNFKRHINNNKDSCKAINVNVNPDSDSSNPDQYCSTQAPHNLHTTSTLLHTSSAQPPHCSTLLHTSSAQPPHCSTHEQPIRKSTSRVKKVHQCDICLQIFSRSDTLKRHKSKYCKILDDIKEEDKEEFEKIISTDIKECSRSMNIVSRHQEDDAYLNELIKDIEIDEQTKLILTALYKQNKQLINLNNDLKNDCKELKNNCAELKNELGKLKHTTINNTQHNTLNSTTNNNIILAHGAEQFDKIDIQIILNYLATIKCKDIIPNMTKHLYLNDSKPENKNFCVVDMSRNKCKYFNGKKWMVGKTNDKINGIFEKVQGILTEPFEKDKIEKTIQFIKTSSKFKNKEKWIKYANSYLNKLYDEEDRENIDNKNKILEELKIIFFNHKDDILKINLS